MASLETRSSNPKRGHHVINNGVKKIYTDIIETFVTNFGVNYFCGKTYSDLKQENIISEVGLPEDCVLGIAPLDDKTISIIVQSTAYFSRAIDENALLFGHAKTQLLYYVTSLMRHICISLKERRLMPRKIKSKLKELSRLIKSFNRNVYVDEMAKKKWEEYNVNDAASLEDAIQKVENMIANIADEDTMQLVVHWGQWAFRVSEGIEHGRLKPN